MKTVQMSSDFDYHATDQSMIAYKADHTYERVPNAAAEAIVAAGAGTVIGEEADSDDTGTEKSRRRRT